MKNFFLPAELPRGRGNPSQTFFLSLRVAVYFILLLTCTGVGRTYHEYVHPLLDGRQATPFLPQMRRIFLFHVSHFRIRKVGFSEVAVSGFPALTHDPQ